MSELAEAGSSFWHFRDTEGRVVAVDAGTRRVTIGGKPSKLDARCFDLLHFLVTHPRQRITRAELIAGAWCCNSLSDATVNSQICRLRQIIGEDAIVTLRGGYQFVPEVGNGPLLIDAPITVASETPMVTQSPITIQGLGPKRAPTLIGRVDDLDRLAARCRALGNGAAETGRMLQLIGPGGVGKTSLVLAVAQALAGEFPGITYVDLAGLATPTALVAEAGRALGISYGGRTPSARALAGRIGGERMLLILDTCEYAAAAVAELVLLLDAACPRLVILAVSQRLLPLRSAEPLRLGPLSLEDGVALFQSRLAPDGETADPDQIREICQRIDLLPLYLEMVAGWAKAHGLRFVRERLADLVPILAETGSALLPERQRRLEAVLSWSYGLLGPDEQQSFRRLAVLAGPISSDAAIAVLGAFEKSRSPWDLLASLRGLADCSLLLQIGGAVESAYVMLGSLREFALVKLEESGEIDRAAAAQARFFIERFERAEIEFETMPDAEWRRIYGPDLDNLRRARDWVMARPDRIEIAVRFYAACSPLWVRLSFADEIRAGLEEIIALGLDDVPLETKGAIFRVAAMVWRQSNRRRALSYTKRSAEAYQQSGDDQRSAMMMAWIGGDLVCLGEYPEAKFTLERSKTIIENFRAIKSHVKLASELASCCLLLGDLENAGLNFSVMRQLARSLKDPIREGFALASIGEVEYRLGATARAIELAISSADILRRAGELSYLGSPLLNLAAYLVLSGDVDAARTAAIEAFPLVRSGGGYWFRVCCQVWALIGAKEGHMTEAAQLRGFVKSDYKRTGERGQLLMEHVNEQLEKLLQARLSSTELIAADRQGEWWNFDDAAEFLERRLIS
jgi:predicted ATPase/DNA-binding winged helix-turn-helix (wHTH) protein